MALKTAVITISAKGRDHGKIFHITEKPAAVTEEFAMRVLFAALNAGAEVPDDVAQMGMAGLVQMGVKAFALIPYDKLQPLFAEMMECVMYQPDKTKPEILRAPTFDGDIEEVGTRLLLRKEIFKLHTDFFTAAAA